EIDEACRLAGRPRSSVRLVAASKAQPATAVREAADAGQLLFGENYAREMRDKRLALAGLHGLNLEWHFIGRVQTGNAKEISNASLVHGVGSLEQARALAKRGPVRALLQLSLWDEASKNGFEIEELRRDLPVLRELVGLTLAGFMAMPPPAVEAPAAFAKVREVRDSIAPDLQELSMGMSADFPAAIREGATLVRIGTALFGARS
ncbi:MAG TPA: YggS family pyridoxal phosphate-dependent enzyme, partial [Myxococcota bacterium]